MTYVLYAFVLHSIWISSYSFEEELDFLSKILIVTAVKKICLK